MVVQDERGVELTRVQLRRIVPSGVWLCKAGGGLS